LEILETFSHQPGGERLQDFQYSTIGSTTFQDLYSFWPPLRKRGQK